MDKKRVIAITILVIVVLAIWVCAIGATTLTKNGNSIEPFKFPEISVSGNDGFTEQIKAVAQISAKSGMNFVAGQSQQRVEFNNPNDNPCVFVVSLYLGDGTLLFTTNPIKPGETVHEVNLMHELKPGIYKDAILVYDCFAENGDPLTRCEFIIEINNK